MLWILSLLSEPLYFVCFYDACRIVGYGSPSQGLHFKHQIKHNCKMYLFKTVQLSLVVRGLFDPYFKKGIFRKNTNTKIVKMKYHRHVRALQYDAGFSKLSIKTGNNAMSLDPWLCQIWGFKTVHKPTVLQTCLFISFYFYLYVLTLFC